MGFLVWAALSTLTLAAGLAVALRVGRGLPLGEQLTAAGVTAVAIVVGAIEALGYLNVLEATWLASTVIVADLLLLGLVRPDPGDWSGLPARLRLAARHSVTGWSAVAVVAAALLVVYMALYIWVIPSWGWDARWYHHTMTAYAIQEHSLRWIGTSSPFVDSYPKNIELIGLWNVIFAPDDRLIDGAQLPLVLLGALALATMLRRAGAAPDLSWGLSLCWLLVPAVFLNTPSGYNDAACAGLWLVAVLFLARTDATNAHRFFGALALGVYLGGKVTGALHAALLAPVVAAVLIVQIVRSPGRRLLLTLQPVLMSVVILALGIATYARNWQKFSNPVWPAIITVLGKKLPGTWELSRFNTPPWGGPDNLEALWKSFYTRSGMYIYDIRTAGFGPLWLVVLLPLLIVALIWGIWRLLKSGTGTPGWLAAVVLLVTAIATPAAWWCRYTLGLPAAGLLGAAMVLTQLRSARVRQAALVAICIFAVAQGVPGLAGFQESPLDLWHGLQKSPRERLTMDPGHWHQPGLDRREDVLLPGDTAVYDDSVTFIYDLWRLDLKNRVLFRPLHGNADHWREGIEAEGARWAAVAQHGPAAKSLQRAGWTSVGPCPSDGCEVWMHPRE